jgi:hypothetical protein
MVLAVTTIAAPLNIVAMFSAGITARLNFVGIFGVVVVEVSHLFTIRITQERMRGT